MTAPSSPSLSQAKELTRAWKALGVPSGSSSALVFGPSGADLARAVQTDLAPESLTALLDKTPPRARFVTTAMTIDELATAQPGAFDVVLAGGGLEEGALASTRERLVQIGQLLKGGGVAGIAVETMAAPVSGERPYDALLFPHLARAGELGDEVASRTPLPASAWLALLQAIGFDVIATQGIGAQTLPQDLVEDHLARMDVYDARELSTGRLIIVARKRERTA